MPENRRIHARVPTRLPARLRRGAESLEGILENVGPGGAFFATEVLEVAIDEGARVEVEFEARRGSEPERVRSAGCVLRTERYFDGKSVVRAFAVRFDAPLDLAGLDLAAGPPG